MKIFLIILFIWLITLFIGKICETINLTGDDSSSVYKPGIQVIKTLRGTGYTKYVQMVYINPNEENKLMILIKPNYWGVLTEKDKKIILSKITKKWKKIYKSSDPKIRLTPEVHFANI